MRPGRIATGGSRWQKPCLPLIQHLVTIHSGFMSYINLSSRGEALFDKFVRGQLSAAQVTAELAEEFKASPMRKA